MKADDSALNAMLEIAANDAPITPEDLRALLPKDCVVDRGTILMYVAMARAGMSQKSMSTVSKEFEYVKDRI